MEKKLNFKSKIILLKVKKLMHIQAAFYFKSFYKHSEKNNYNKRQSSS
jgi:hypothetical protein